MQQFIYHINASLNVEYSPTVNIERDDNACFKVISSPCSVLKNIFLLIKRYKLSVELVKLLIKLITKRNALYIVIFNNTITSDGLLSFGKCNHYPVDENDSIIGPVYTDNNYRGKGFATFGLISCVNYLRKRQRYSKIYIDTREDNIAMKKVILKSAFGEAKSSYQRVPNQKL